MLENVGQMLAVGTDGEADSIRLPRCHLDDPPSGRGNLDRYLRHIRLAKPLETARETVSIDRLKCSRIPSEDVDTRSAGHYRQAMRIPSICVVMAVVAFGIAGCGGDDDASSPAPTPTIASPTFTATPAASPTPDDRAEVLLSIPETETWNIDALSAPVQVVRTESNVAHIYAENRRDLAIAHGFVLARDRYVEIELSRRLSLGRVSELLGDTALPLDVEQRLLGSGAVARAIADGLGPDQRQIVEGFAAGVNAYIDQVRAGRLPVPTELALAGPLLGGENPADLMVDVDPLGVAAMITTVLYQSSFESGDVGRAAAMAMIDGLFAGTAQAELRRTGVREDVWNAVVPIVPVSSAAGFGLETGDELIPGPLPQQTSSHSDRAAASRLDSLAKRLARVARRFGRQSGTDFGSNSWAVAGEHTRHGGALVAGDGHLSLDLPPIMHQIGLDTSALGGGDVHQIGLTIPGLPIMIVGSNGMVAWSQTQLSADVTDWYAESLRLGDDGLPDATYFQGEWRPLGSFDETYQIADVPALGSVGRTEVFRRWVTFDGRWLFDVEGRELAGDEEPGSDDAVVVLGERRVVPGDADDDGLIGGVSFDYAGFEAGPVLTGPDGFGHSRNIEEFRASSRALVAVSQNIVAGDADGNIFYTSYNPTPCRSQLPRNADGWVEGANPRLLLDGTLYGAFTIPLENGLPDESAGASDPSRCLVPFDSTPQSLNPERGYVLTANNDPGDITFDGSLTDDPWYIGGPWDIGFRAGRIDEVLSAAVERGDVTLDEMIALQGDHRSALAPRLTPYLFEAMQTAAGLAATDGPKTPAEERLAALWTTSEETFLAARERLRIWGEHGYEAASGVETFYHQPQTGELDDAVGTMIFNAWVARFVGGVWDDEMIPDALFQDGNETRVNLILRSLAARDGAGPPPASTNPDTGELIFFDRADTSELETSREIIVAALADALSFLASEPSGPGRGGFGTTEMDAWLWGLRHQVRFESLLNGFLGDDPLFEIFTSVFAIDTRVLPLAPSFPAGDPRADLRWFPRPGDNWGVDAANPGFSGTDFTYGDGPVMRMVFALGSDGFEGVNIVPGGQSGLTDSPFFADQAALWLGNETIPLRFEVDDVAAGATGREVLRPE
jgi:penicillin amidase